MIIEFNKEYHKLVHPNLPLEPFRPIAISHLFFYHYGHYYERQYYSVINISVLIEESVMDEIFGNIKNRFFE